MTLDQLLATPPAAGAGFSAAWPVRTGDVDPYNRLRMDGIARYLQDIAWENAHATVIATSDPMWIVRRTVIDVVRPVTWPDNVRLHRWCAGVSSHWATMRVRITSANGALIETEGFWVNFSEATNTPTRISGEGRALLATTADNHRLRWRAWLTDPPPAASEADLSFPVRATDIDQYNHVNNAAYWQAVEQYLVDYPKLVAGPHRAVIEYNSAVLARENITIRSHYDPGDHTNGPRLRLWFLVGEVVSTTVLILPLPTIP